jgi:hypothetical protein
MSAPVGIGDTVAGKYVIERHLAKGGMGVVVVARHLQLGRQVAIKFMLPHLLAAGVEPGAVERFVREGRAAVRLRGENVARVLDVDTLTGGIPYMVMEYLEGQDLGHHIKRHGPLPLAESVDYVLQACVAMAEAHLCGIIHRDLKPSNLFVTRRPDGSTLIKVLDFGISKLYEDSGGEATQTAAIMGSPSYMAPEQAQSARDADARSDIWSLGVILYECTSRQLPFAKAASTAAVVAQLIYEQPRPLADVAPSLPAAFCQVVDTCLSKDPFGRYQSIGELASALLPFASAVGRQAAASVHAIIGGAGVSPGASAAVSPGAGAAVSPGAAVASKTLGPGAGGSLQHADTHLASAAPSMTRRGPAPAPTEAAVLALDADALAAVSPLELAVEPRAAEARSEAAPSGRAVAGAPGRPVAGDPGPLSEHSLPTGWRAWVTAERVKGLSAAVVLGVLTALVMLSGAEPLWPVSLLEALNAAIHRLGYELAGSLGRHQRILVGPAVEVAIPLVLALVLTAVRVRHVAMVAWWWLGATVALLSRSLIAAPWEQRSPITGDLEPWSHWLVAWKVHAHAETLSRAVFWAGALLMSVAVLVSLGRVVRGRWR